MGDNDYLRLFYSGTNRKPEVVKNPSVASLMARLTEKCKDLPVKEEDVYGGWSTEEKIAELRQRGLIATYEAFDERVDTSNIDYGNFENPEQIIRLVEDTTSYLALPIITDGFEKHGMLDAGTRREKRSKLPASLKECIEDNCIRRNRQTGCLTTLFSSEYTLKGKAKEIAHRIRKEDNQIGKDFGYSDLTTPEKVDYVWNLKSNLISLLKALGE